MATPQPPKSLAAAGKSLWRDVVASIPDGWELDGREIVLLKAAARQADDVAALERAIKKGGIAAKGSAGQPRLSPLLTEVRQGRLAIGRLLSHLPMPDGAEEPRTHAGKRGQKAARARWDRVAEQREKRERAAGA